MDYGIWVWPSDQSAQRRVLRLFARSDHLVAALKAIAKSKDGLSNAELDDTMSDNSNWMTLWSVRQLLSLGFIEYKVDFFGGPAKYIITDLGRSVLQYITGQPLAPKPQPPVPLPAAQSPPSSQPH
jgi:hypothetical protein